MSDNLFGLNVFVDSARHMCAWLEGPPMDPDHGISTAIKLLSSVHSEAMQLPAIVGDNNDINAPTICEEHIESMQTRFAEFPLKRFELNDPCDSEAENKVYNIFSAFALIHQFIKTGLDYYEQGERETALHYWKKGFKFHWGAFVAGFIYALHCSASAKT